MQPGQRELGEAGYPNSIVKLMMFTHYGWPQHHSGANCYPNPTWVTLNLNRTCKYGGEPEYWVETREVGEKGQEKEEKKERKEVIEDSQI